MYVCMTKTFSLTKTLKFMYVCMYVCMYVSLCMYAWVQLYKPMYLCTVYVYVYVCMYMYVCMYVCMCMLIMWFPSNQCRRYRSTTSCPSHAATMSPSATMTLESTPCGSTSQTVSSVASPHQQNIFLNFKTNGIMYVLWKCMYCMYVVCMCNYVRMYVCIYCTNIK